MLNPAQFFNKKTQNNWDPPKPGTDAASFAKMHRAAADSHMADRAKEKGHAEMFRKMDEGKIRRGESPRHDGVTGHTRHTLAAEAHSRKAAEHTMHAERLEKLSKIDPTKK